jgi:DNA primase
VLALHQAGIRNAVGIMGTSLTEEPVSELERIVKVLELCLDADRAGQDAMLRAARLAAGRKLELRVVALPEGADPADLVQTEGADALRARVQDSVPFVVFNVDRILARADTRSAEGRDRALGELAPLFAQLAPSVLRDQLMRRVSGALELTEARLIALLEAPPPPAPATAPANAASDFDGAPRNGSGPRSERLFLALCIAVPDAGAQALEPAASEQLLTSGSLRRAARHLRGRTRSPLGELPPDDEELARVIAGLVELAGRVPDSSPDRLEHARLVLELERLERAILRARSEGVGTSDLAREREAVRAAYHAVGSRLQTL